MVKNTRTSGGQQPSPSKEDEVWQAAVLGLLLELHPDPLTESELAREIVRDRGFAEHDAFQRAINELIATGLVQRTESFILPTRAAVRFEELEIT